MKNNGEQWTTDHWSNVYEGREEAKGNEMAQGQQEPSEFPLSMIFSGKNLSTLSKRSNVISGTQKALTENQNYTQLSPD